MKVLMHAMPEYLIIHLHESLREDCQAYLNIMFGFGQGTLCPLAKEWTVFQMEEAREYVTSLGFSSTGGQDMLYTISPQQGDKVFSVSAIFLPQDYHRYVQCTRCFETIIILNIEY